MIGASIPPEPTLEQVSEFQKQVWELERNKHDFDELCRKYKHHVDTEKANLENRFAQVIKLEEDLRLKVKELDVKEYFLSSKEIDLTARELELKTKTEILQQQYVKHEAEKENLNRQMWLNKTSEDSLKKALQEIRNG